MGLYQIENAACTMMDWHLESQSEVMKLSLYYQLYIHVGRTGNSREWDSIGLSCQGEKKSYLYPKTLKSHLDRWERRNVSLIVKLKWRVLCSDLPTNSPGDLI